MIELICVTWTLIIMMVENEHNTIVIYIFLRTTNSAHYYKGIDLYVVKDNKYGILSATRSTLRR